MTDRIAGGKAADQAMPQGKKPSTMQGSRTGYLGNGIPANIDGIAVITAGVVSGAPGGAGKNGTVTAGDSSFEGRDKGITLSASGKTMKEGKKPSTKAGAVKGYL